MGRAHIAILGSAQYLTLITMILWLKSAHQFNESSFSSCVNRENFDLLCGWAEDNQLTRKWQFRHNLSVKSTKWGIKMQHSKNVHEKLIKRDIIASYISFSPYAIKVERVISHVICSKAVFLWKDATLILKASFLMRRR